MYFYQSHWRATLSLESTIYNSKRVSAYSVVMQIALGSVFAKLVICIYIEADRFHRLWSFLLFFRLAPSRYQRLFMCCFRFLWSQLRYHEGPLGWRNIFATSRLSLLVLFHVIYYYWGEEYRLLYRGHRCDRFVISRFHLGFRSGGLAAS